MKIVWQARTVTGRDVYERLRERRKVAYTTVMTMMNILERKGHLRKNPGQDRAYVYEPVQPRSQVMRGMVREFLDRVFDGSARPLLVHLAEDRRLKESDLAELRRLIRESEQS